MKILFLTPRFKPDLGGVEKHTYKIAQELINRGNYVGILTSTHKPDLGTFSQIEKMSIYRIFIGKKYTHRINSLINLLKIWVFLLRNFHVLIEHDIIHLHDYQTFLWVFPFLVYLRKPLYITFHGFEGYPVSWTSKILRKIAEENVKGNICVGNFICKWYGTKCQNITLGGVDFPNKIPSSVDNSAIYIGRLGVDTGILDLIDALNILKEEYTVEIPLHICGDGPLRKEIEDQAKNDNLIIFMHGFVAEPNTYIQTCKYAFVSSYLSILETMIQKKPVIAFYNNPLKKDYLYSFPNAEQMMTITGSPKELAEKIFALIKGPKQTNLLVNNAYEFSIKQTWSKVAELYLKLYQQEK
jgi:glycosyltransferase involved in cell wall biosynthesis